MTPLETVQGALAARGLRRTGAYWSCPAHEDRLPSLSVREGAEGRVLLYCHAGCPWQNVVAALGLEPGDLFPGGLEREPDPDWEPEAYWPPYIPKPLPPNPAPPPFFVIDGQRYWSDWRDVAWEDEKPYVPTPHEVMLTKTYPQLDWMLVHPPHERQAWAPDVVRQRFFEEVPEWVWTTLTRS